MSCKLLLNVASRLLNNNTEHCDNFLTVNVSIFKSLLTRVFSPNYIEKCNPIIVNPVVKMRPNPAKKARLASHYEVLTLRPTGMHTARNDTGGSCQAQLPRDDVLQISKTFIYLLVA